MIKSEKNKTSNQETGTWLDTLTTKGHRASQTEHSADFDSTKTLQQLILLCISSNFVELRLVREPAACLE